MKKDHRVGTIVNYCSNDFRFLDFCIEETREFSSQIIIVFADHFFDGTEENRELLEASCQRHPDCLFVEFAYQEHEPYGIYCPVSSKDKEWVRYWHGTNRYIGFHLLDETIETVLFADVDEIHDGKRMLEWLDGFDYRSYNAHRLAGYFYFREAKFCAKTWMPVSLLVRKDAIDPEILFDLFERQGIFDRLAGQKMQMTVGLDGKPLTHHYSWVKTKEEMLVKTRSWGHRDDENWQELIEKEFSRTFSGVDNFYHLTYDEVDPWRDPLRVQPFFPTEKAIQNKLKFDRNSFFKFTILKKKP